MSVLAGIIQWVHGHGNQIFVCKNSTPNKKPSVAFRGPSVERFFVKVHDGKYVPYVGEEGYMINEDEYPLLAR